jgi:hypothetical protein
MINIASLRHRNTRGVLQMLAARAAWIRSEAIRLRPVDGIRRGPYTPEMFFDNAPDTVLIFILGHLNALDILSAGATCRSLRRIIKQPFLWRNVCIDASWSPVQVAAVVEACVTHAVHVRVNGCRDPHVNRQFAVVTGRFARIITEMTRAQATTLPLQLLEARADVPTRHPTFRRSNTDHVVDITAHIERLRAVMPHITVHMGGAAPMYCAASVDWYMSATPCLRLDALSDIVVQSDHMRGPNLPCMGFESARLVAASGARTVFVTVIRWVEGEPLRAAAALLSAGARDLRIRLSPVCGVPALPAPSTETPAGILECLHVEFTGRTRPAPIETWLTWFQTHSGVLREVCLTDNTVGTEMNARNAKTALHALRQSLAAPLDVLDLRNIDVLNPASCDENLLAILSSENAPSEVRICEYILFLEDTQGARLFARSLSTRVRRVVITILDAGFGLHERYFLRDIPRLELPVRGVVTADFAAKKIDVRFVFV